MRRWFDPNWYRYLWHRRMRAFDLTPPSLMFGRIKVGDKVKVRFDLVLKS